MEKDEMGGACSAYGGRGEEYTGFWWGNLEEFYAILLLGVAAL